MHCLYVTILECMSIFHLDWTHKVLFWWYPKSQLVGWSQLLRLNMLSRHVFCVQHVCISTHLPIAWGFLESTIVENGPTFRTVISFKGKHWDQLLWINNVWRIIPVSKWFENPIYKPFKEGVPRPQVLGTTTITTCHLEIYSWRKLLFYLGRSVQDGLPYVHQ